MLKREQVTWIDCRCDYETLFCLYFPFIAFIIKYCLL